MTLVHSKERLFLILFRTQKHSCQKYIYEEKLHPCSQYRKKCPGALDIVQDTDKYWPILWLFLPQVNHFRYKTNQISNKSGSHFHVSWRIWPISIQPNMMSTAPTWKEDLNLSKWGLKGDLILSEMGTKRGPSVAEKGTKWGPKKRIFDKLTETC